MLNLAASPALVFIPPALPVYYDNFAPAHPHSSSGEFQDQAERSLCLHKRQTPPQMRASGDGDAAPPWDSSGFAPLTSDAHTAAGSSVWLGDDVGFLCDDEKCAPTEIFLTTEPAHHPGLTCVLQPGLRMDGRPVYACGSIEEESR